MSYCHSGMRDMTPDDIKKLDQEGLIVVSKPSIDTYEMDHKYCPQCGNTNYSQTLMSFHYDGPDSKDTNRIKCFTCGFMGIIHDLVSSPKIK